MNKVLEESKQDALSYAFLFSLPNIYEGNDVWIRAIGLVTKSNTEQNYCILARDYNGDAQVIKDFGNSSKIVRIDEVRPYMFLDQKYIVEFKNKAEIINYLLVQYREYTDEELKQMKGSQLKTMCINLWINKQLEDYEIENNK